LKYAKLNIYASSRLPKGNKPINPPYCGVHVFIEIEAAALVSLGEVKVWVSVFFR
jgi:hypothetical protein